MDEHKNISLFGPAVAISEIKERLEKHGYAVSSHSFSPYNDANIVLSHGDRIYTDDSVFRVITRLAPKP